MSDQEILTKEVKIVLNANNLQQKIRNCVALKKHLDEVTELLDQQKKDLYEQYLKDIKGE